jgi:zinc protease
MATFVLRLGVFAWLACLPLPLLADPRPEFSDAPYRAQQPPAGPPAELRLPHVEKFTLSNGLEVQLVTRSTLPTVQMDFEVAGGSRLDTPGREGQASLCTALAGESTQKLERAAYREALADLAASVSPWANREQMGVSLAVLKRNLPQTLALWSDVLLHPGMRAADLERLTAQRLAALSQQKSSVGGLAGRLQSVVTWGAQHPLGRVMTETSLNGLTPETCAALWQGRMQPKGAHLYVVGDLTRAELVAALKPLFEAWRGQAPALPPLPPAEFVPRQLLLVDVPGSAQASVNVIHLGPSRKDKAYPALSLMAAILGGGFSSRINMNLREQHGWAYGARGAFDFVAIGSVWQVAASVRTDAAGPAVAEIFKEMAKMHDELATPDELARERDGFIGGLPARWVTSSAILNGLESLHYLGLPLDDDAQMPARWQKTTLEQVRAAAQAFIHPGEATVLVVGDAAKVQQQLLELTQPGGPLAGVAVTRLNADGQPL